MKILIDIKHPAHLNLFKGLVKELRSENWDITICYLERGKLPRIINTELADFHTIPVGQSNGTKWSIFWDGNFKRVFNFLQLIKSNKYNICIAVSSVPLALASRICGTPVIQFYDDPERGGINKLNENLSNQIFFPPIVKVSGKTSTFNCLKEWSYLSPTRFHPDASVLKKYDLQPYNYVFAREVSNKSFNYFKQPDALICSLSKEIDKKAKVLLSLEDKKIAKKFPGNWIILEEPVADIHSLIYYSKLMVSSGDSMAREGAMLGVPSVYCGIREMKANELLIKKDLLKHLPLNNAIKYINERIGKDFNEAEQFQVRTKLLNEWDDMVGFMKSQINNYKS